MKQDKKPAIPQPLSKPRKAIDAIRNFKGYADIQHFYKSKLNYAQPAEKDNEQSFILGYN